MLRRCRHLKAFDITTTVNDPAHAALPPWAVLCEDCAATVFETLKAQREVIKNRHPSGKSSSAVMWARAGRLLEDWGKP